MNALNLRADAEHLLKPALQRSALVRYMEKQQADIRLYRESMGRSETEEETAARLERDQVEFSDIATMDPVRLQNRAEMAAQESQGLADIYDFQANETVEIVRYELSRFTAAEEKYLDTLLDSNSEFSPFLKSLNPPGTLSWATWLMREPEEGGATDDQVKNVLQWHVDYVDRMNGGHDGVDRIHEAFQLSRDSYIKAAEAGLLPAELIGRLQEAKQEEIVYEDIFKLARELNHGFAYLDSHAIHLPGPEQVRVRLHEFSHAYIGTMYPGKEKIAGKRWLDEALTEIIASIAQTGTVEAIYEFDDDKFYPAERKLLAAILDTPDCPLTLEGLIHTYCNGTVEEKAEVFTTINAIFENYLMADSFSLQQNIETLGVNPLYVSDETQYLEDLAFILNDAVARRGIWARRDDLVAAT